MNTNDISPDPYETHMAECLAAGVDETVRKCVAMYVGGRNVYEIGFAMAVAVYALEAAFSLGSEAGKQLNDKTADLIKTQIEAMGGKLPNVAEFSTSTPNRKAN